MQKEPVKLPALDLCLTTLVRDASKPLWMQFNLRAAPFSAVLTSPFLRATCDIAEAIYDAMDAGGAVVPTVTLLDGSVKLAYEDDDRLAVFLFDPGQVRFATGTKGHPITFVSGEPVTELVTKIAAWVVQGVAL